MSARDEVERIYRELIGLPAEWSEQQSAAFIEAEIVRIERIESQAQASLADHALAAYRKTHGGVSPKYLEHVGMLRSTQLQATEIALQELYEQIPAPPEDEMDADAEETDAQFSERKRAEHRSDPQRWKTPWCEDPFPDHAERIEAIWPGKVGYFHWKMGELWTVRWEDGMPLPDSADDPLAAELEQMVEAFFATEAEDWVRERVARQERERAAEPNQQTS